MLTKTKIILATLATIGFAQAALASEALNARIGDNYPFLEHTVTQPAGASAYASVSGPIKGFTAAERGTFERASRYANSY